MNDATAFTGTVPEIYDRDLGPVLFAPFAADLARRVAAARPARVLELAAGTGIATRALRDLLPAETALTATDLNPPMLAIARAKFRPEERVEFRPADAMALPFPDAAFDALACQFGAMFFPDKVASFREARRVLAPGGRYVFNVWDAVRHNPNGRLVLEVAAELFPADPPRFFEVPHGYHSLDAIKEALLEAGFLTIRAEVLRLMQPVPRAADFARGLVFGTPLIGQIAARGGSPEAMAERLAEAMAREIGPDPARFPLQAIVVEAA